MTASQLVRMSLARGPGRLMTTARYGPTVTPCTLASLATRRPDIPRQPKFGPVGRGVQARHMHWTAVIESSIKATEDTLVGLHALVGLPWYLAIPAVAVGVNFAVRFPLQYYVRNRFLKRYDISHLPKAWMIRHAMMIGGDHSARMARKSTRRLYKERGIQQWKNYLPVLSVAPWLVVSDALRRVTGVDGGLLSLLLPEKSYVVNDSSKTADALDVWTGQDVLAATQEVTDAVQPAVLTIQQSLASGGALWFPDLTAADPYALLPFMLSASFLHNVLPRDRKAIMSLLKPGQEDVPRTRPEKLRNVVQRSFILVALLAPFITMNLPAGMLLYWVSSSALTAVNSLLIDYFQPAPTTPNPKGAVCMGRPMLPPDDEVRP